MSAITWHCSTYKHAQLVEFKGTPDEERLALESHEFLHTIDSALEHALKLTAPVDTVSLLDEMPAVALYFNQVYPRSDNPVTEADRPRMLEAFGRLVRFSTKLNACPPVKTAFWATIASSMCSHDTRNMHRQLFGRPAYPQFVIDCSNKRYETWSTLNESLCDAVYDFLTSSSDETTASAHLPLGLSFGFDEPAKARTKEHLELIERMLDRVSTSPTQQFKITVLDLNNAILNPPELEVVTRIVAKCTSGFYLIEQVTLDAMIPYIRTQGISPSETPRAFLDITSAAFSPVDLPRFWSFKPPVDLPTRVDNPPSVLHKVSLDKNVFTQGFYSAHFSTLRYGCPLEEDLTDYSITTRNSDEQTIDCWRWLAFGLFYPRPKRFAAAYKLRTIGKLTLDPVAIKTIVNTVRNPAAQLVDNATEGGATSPADCLMVCTVKEGAEIEVFVSGLQREERWRNYGVASPWFKSLLATSEFEALCEREDGLVCVQWLEKINSI